MLRHFVRKGNPIPIWAMFELVTMGDLGSSVECMGPKEKADVEYFWGTADNSYSNQGEMLARHIFILKELRNAIAHNKIDILHRDKYI